MPSRKLSGKKMKEGSKRGPHKGLGGRKKSTARAVHARKGSKKGY